MRAHSRYAALYLCILFAVPAMAVPPETPAARPNIIYILADDLGYGDLSCYGQQTLSTPNLDRLAQTGIRFTQHYAGSTVCAPSRCVLMTGLHTGHCRVRGNGPGQLRGSDLTVASVLRKSGYRTGCFGKWGIGNPPPIDDPQRHGFDEFFGYINMFHAHNYYPEFLIRNGKRVPTNNKLFSHWKNRQTPQKEGFGVAEVAVDYAPKLISDAMLEFIKQSGDEPFFLYYALNIPHANNEGGGEKRIQRNGMRTPDLGSFSDKDWPIQEQGFAQMIHYIDQDVGSILDLLRSLQIDDETVVFFSSDNGPHEEGGHKMPFFDSNGPLRGMKRALYDGGIRVPMLACWPGHIPARATTDHISGFQDVFPTLLDLAGVKEQPHTDGISMAPTLLGSAGQQQHEHLYWEFYEQGGRVGVRKGPWKAVRNNVMKDPNAPIELYDITKDPGEQQDLAANHSDVVATMARIMAQCHTDPEAQDNHGSND